MGLHQEHELTSRSCGACCLMILLLDNNCDGVNQKLKLRRSTQESNGFRISKSKIEYVHCEFSLHKKTEVRLDGVVVIKCKQFRYLGS